jgi:hypothetical protein
MHGCRCGSEVVGLHAVAKITAQKVNNFAGATRFRGLPLPILQPRNAERPPEQRGTMGLRTKSSSNVWFRRCGWAFAEIIPYGLLHLAVGPCRYMEVQCRLK